jgi:hypothetical protein
MGLGPEILGAVAGSAAGGALGNMMGGGDEGGVDIDAVLAQYNGVLNNALSQAIQSATQGTQQATGQLNQSLGTATGILNNATNQAGQTAGQYTDYGFNMGQGLNTPYREAGYGATDAYLQSLGLAIPNGGSAMAAKQGQMKAQYQKLLSDFGGKAPTDPGQFTGTAPTAFDPNSVLSTIGNDQISNWLNQNMRNEMVGFTRNPNELAMQYAYKLPGQNNAAVTSYKKMMNQTDPVTKEQAMQQAMANPEIAAQIKNYLAQPGIQQGQAAYQQQLQQYQQQQADYQKQADTYNKYNQSYQGLTGQGFDINYDPSAPATGTGSGPAPATNPLSGFYNSSQFKNLYGDTPQGTDPLQNFQNTGAFRNLYGDQAQSGDALENFFNSPGYKLLFGEGNNQVDPTERFKFDPGYQFAQDEASKQLQRNYASKGLLESGPMLLELQKQSQGMADQNYQRWLGQQNQLFNTDQQTRNALYAADQAQRGGLLNNYQNQLQGLSTLGSQMTGANTAASMYGSLGNLLSGQQYGTGNTLFQGNMQTGQNIAELLANLGVYTGNAQMATGAAQGQGLWNALNAAMQSQNNAAASQSGSMNAQQANQGYLAGANLLGGGLGGFNQQQPQSFSGGKPFNIQIGPGGSF